MNKVSKNGVVVGMMAETVEDILFLATYQSPKAPQASHGRISGKTETFKQCPFCPLQKKRVLSHVKHMHRERLEEYKELVKTNPPQHE